MEMPSPANTEESNGNNPYLKNIDTEQGDENEAGNTNNNHQYHTTLHLPQGLMSTPQSSVEDLSEYTDADESISSAPTEFLAEFLSALMLKDYATALKYCKLILQYEPNNTTAKEFYPFIVEKLHLMEEQEESNSSSSSSNDDSSSDGEGKPARSSESDSDATTASYSSLEDDEADGNQNNDNADAGNGNNCTGTTQNVLSIAKLIKEMALEPNVSGGCNGEPATFQSTSSDSESPTEPVSQPTIAQLRATVVPSKAK